MQEIESNKELLYALLGYLAITHWAGVVWIVKRIIDWTHMQRDIAEMKKKMATLEGDVNEAFKKIRSKD